MTDLKEEFAQLVSLTKIYMHQEFDKEEWILAEPEGYDSLKAFALQRQNKKNKEPEPNPIPTLKTSVPIKPKASPYPAPILKEKEVIQKEATLSEAPRKIVENKEIKTSISKQNIERQVSPPPAMEDFNELRKIMQKLFPGQPIVEVPDEKAMKSQGSPEILIISDEKGDLEQIFVRNLAKAIQISLSSALVVSSSDKRLHALLNGPDIKLIIGLKESLRGIPSSKNSLSSIDILPVESYMQNPKAKAELWTTICERYKL